LANPQLAIDANQPGTADINQIIRDRQMLIDRIAESLAHRRFEEKDQRTQWFREIHALNAKLHAAHPAILQKIDVKIGQVMHTLANQKVINHREWFFPLHHRDSLAALLSKITSP
jgi:hypothetical protein